MRHFVDVVDAWQIMQTATVPALQYRRTLLPFKRFRAMDFAGFKRRHEAFIPVLYQVLFQAFLAVMAPRFARRSTARR